MTYYVLYNQASGSIIDISENSIASVEIGQALKAFSEPLPSPIDYEWDKVELMYKLRAVPTKEEERPVTVYQFMSKFTQQERVTIKTVAKTEVALQDYLDMVNQAQYIDLNSVDVRNGLIFLSSIGLLNSFRIPEILA